MQYDPQKVIWCLTSSLNHPPSKVFDFLPANEWQLGLAVIVLHRLEGPGPVSAAGHTSTQLWSGNTSVRHHPRQVSCLDVCHDFCD